MMAIRRMADENTIVVSDDLDEVLRPESILQYDPNKYLYASTELMMSYYYFN
jgi:hypothetical protein